MKEVIPERLELELWGGIEATVNRVQDRFFDQVVRTGHHDRLEDLKLFADLGLRTLRYPILWERTAPDGIGQAQWHWADERLPRLRELGIRPIVGLLHHGSGPRDTSLLDPSFPERLAEYAGAVAHRFPWVTDYTPVNEPLTTARFAALYGHWYPHHRDDISFAHALLNQCRGTVLAMEAIRAVNPDARLIQTDDLGKTFATDRLRYQADFENERRWVTYDLLTGRLAPDSPMWQWFQFLGVDTRELEWFREYPCPPSIIGVNIYPSSQRFLDHRIDRYPGETPGTNGRDTYVDVLAFRAMDDGVLGVEALLTEAWNRFGLPLAITESHNSGGREEQIRWLGEVWRAAQAARQTGVDVRAVTVWALLGLFDWAHLVTIDRGLYEPGVLDIRGPSPRLTALATMVQNLATNGSHAHPVLDVPGWWRRSERIDRAAACPDRTKQEPKARACPATGRPLLVIGSSGPLYDTVLRALSERKLSDRIMTIDATGIGSGAVTNVVREHHPWAVIDVGDVEWWGIDFEDSAPCFRIVAVPCLGLASACEEAGACLMLFSSDLVFDGHQRLPYTELDTVRPFELSGQRCAKAEQLASQRCPESLVVRSGPIFSYEAQPQPHKHMVTGLVRGVAEMDDVISPSNCWDVVQNALDLLVDREKGIWHLASPGGMTWRDCYAMLGIYPLPGAVSLQDGAIPGQSERVIRHHVLGSNRGQLMPLLVNEQREAAVELR